MPWILPEMAVARGMRVATIGFFRAISLPLSDSGLFVNFVHPESPFLLPQRLTRALLPILYVILITYIYIYNCLCT